jgi:hypothetical protein
VMGDLPAVLVVHTEVRSPALGVRYGTIWLDGITRHGFKYAVVRERKRTEDRGGSWWVSYRGY